MDVDLSALKALERDKEISMEVLLGALSDALLNAYEKTPGAVDGARAGTTDPFLQRRIMGETPFLNALSESFSKPPSRFSRGMAVCVSAPACKVHSWPL